VSVHHVPIVLQSKRVVYLLKVRSESILHISLDLSYSLRKIGNLQLIFGHIDVELFQIFLDILNLLLDIVFLMIELYVVVLLNITHEALYGAFIPIHGISQLIFLLKVHVSHFIKGVIVNLEQALYMLLMTIQFIHHLLLLLNIRMLKFNDFLLYFVSNFSQHNIVMPAMIGDAKLAVEGLIDFAAELYLLVFVLLAKELARIVVEIIELV
jgi:hypothetical protein